MHRNRSVHQADTHLHRPVSNPFSTHLTPYRLLLTALCLAVALLLVPGIVAQREEAFALARTGVSANQDWTPYVEMFDGVPMVLVPSGCFLMGSIIGNADETPVHQVCIDAPFWLDQTEVTQGDFARLGGIKRTRTPRPIIGDRLPVNLITWFEASAFCAQRGGRLPTEAEWEFAARGPDWLPYPWGVRFVADNVVYAGNSDGRPAEVMSRPGGVSWVGAHDMAGNVIEWTSTLYQPYPYNADDGREADTGDRQDVRRVLRGGSWLDNSFFVSVGFRGAVMPIGTSNVTGLRCARDFVEG
jgi:formylglycine-generating enzyme required for sulfatase activity